MTTIEETLDALQVLTAGPPVTKARRTIRHDTRNPLLHTVTTRFWWIDREYEVKGKGSTLQEALDQVQAIVDDLVNP